jgi:hypothetical protein
MILLTIQMKDLGRKHSENVLDKGTSEGYRKNKKDGLLHPG